ncbi:hypothetical protein NDU88_004276 [Pleurodeles waltl]|uniref:Uncharacterized protein n=1 Tax=Pleurodeles waltl TaxID=8319 RepID=A0AAV7LJG3_PLEWA|nr:hypothetical protein NDU88_004276 [Pleurodeles waltl]
MLAALYSPSPSLKLSVGFAQAALTPQRDPRSGFSRSRGESKGKPAANSKSDGIPGEWRSEVVFQAMDVAQTPDSAARRHRESPATTDILPEARDDPCGLRHAPLRLRPDTRGEAFPLRQSAPVRAAMGPDMAAQSRGEEVWRQSKRHGFENRAGRYIESLWSLK